MKDNKLSRRRLFQWGLGTAGAMTAAPAMAQVCRVATGPQGLGPFFPRDNTPIDPIRESQNTQTPISMANDNDLTFVLGRSGTADGQQVIVEGQVTDENCEPVSGATVIIWQASSTGQYNHNGDDQNQNFRHPISGQIIERILDPHFQYWGKAVTDANGFYEFKTIVPGFYPADLTNGWYRPPHIHFLVSATGFPQLVTQMYFRGDEILVNEFIQDLNQKDLLLQGRDLSNEQRQALIVDFSRQDASPTLVGEFPITLKR